MLLLFWQLFDLFAFLFLLALGFYFWIRHVCILLGPTMISSKMNQKIKINRISLSFNLDQTAPAARAGELHLSR
ncbi:hypothetical protein AB2762_11180 [Acinetobacter indicus]